MKTQITQAAEYFLKLLQADQQNENKLGRVSVDYILHRKSENINAASVEFKMQVFDETSASEFPLNTVRCTVMLIDKVVMNSETKDEYLRTCSVIMNDDTREIVWDRITNCTMSMCDDTPKNAVKWLFGYMINCANRARRMKPMKNVSEYVEKLIDSQLAEDTEAVEATEPCE